MVLLAGDGTPLLDVTAPGGAQVVERRLRLDLPRPDGERRVRTKPSAPGAASVVVVAKGMSITAPAALTPPAVAIVALDTPYVTIGQCATSAFATCAAVKHGTTIKCR